MDAEFLCLEKKLLQVLESTTAAVYHAYRHTYTQA